MKKLSILTILFVIALSLCAEFDERKPLMNYYENQSFDTFLKAVSYYGIKSDINQDPNTKAYLMSILYNELNNTMEYMIANSDSLTPGSAFQTANILLAMGEYDKAVVLYNKLNEKSPKWSCPWRHKGEALLKMNELDKAVIALKNAIETRKEHYDAYLMLAEVYYKQKNYKEAYTTMQDAFKYKGSDAENEEEVYSNKSVDFLYLDILKANKMKKEADILEKQLKTKYPEDQRWK